MSEPLISICIPVYNGEKYLEQCLESCLSQTFKDFEIIICDDGSTDGSPRLVEAFIKNDPRIKYFRNEKNLGLVGNWNNSIKKANGKWIKMLFQDDYMSPDCLLRFSEYTHKNIPLLTSRRNFVFEYEPAVSEAKNFKEKSLRFDNWAHGKATVITPRMIAATAARNININFIAEPSLTLFRKEEAIKEGLFDQDFMQVCDLDFLLRLSGKRGLLYLPYDLCYFRLHKATTTSSNLTMRGFELRYLEPLLMATRLLTHRGYAALTSHFTGFEKFRIRLYLNTRLTEARLAARQTGNIEKLNSYLDTHVSVRHVAKPGVLHTIALVALRLKRSLKR